MQQRTIEQLELIYFKLNNRLKIRGELTFLFSHALTLAKDDLCAKISDRIGLEKNYRNSFFDVTKENRTVEVRINNRYYTFILSNVHYTNNNNMFYFIAKHGPVRTMFVRNNGLIEY